jgi:molybdopterin converting factor small subunit
MATLIPHYDLAKSIGEHKLEVDVRNVRELLAELERRYGQRPAGGEGYLGRVAILVNGRHINNLQGMDTPLKDDDEIWFLLPSGGG